MDNILETLVTLDVHMGNEDSSTMLERNSRVERAFSSLRTLLTNGDYGPCTKKLKRMYVSRITYIFREIASDAPRRALLVLLYLVKALVMTIKHTSSINTAILFHGVVVNISKQKELDLRNKSFMSGGLDDREKEFVSSICNPSSTMHNAHVISSLYIFFLHSLSSLEKERIFKDAVTVFMNMNTNVIYPYLLTSGLHTDPTLIKDVTGGYKYKHILLQLFVFGTHIPSSSLYGAYAALVTTVTNGLTTPALITAMTSIMAHADLSVGIIVCMYNKLLDHAQVVIDTQIFSQRHVDTSLHENLQAILNSVTYILVQRYEQFLNSKNLLPSSELFSKLAWIYDRDYDDHLMEQSLNPVLRCYVSIILSTHFQRKDDQNAVIERLNEIKKFEFHECVQALSLKHLILSTGIAFKFYPRQYNKFLPSNMPSIDETLTIEALIKHFKRATFYKLSRTRAIRKLYATKIMLNMDVWSSIISYCNVIQLCRLQCVSKNFNKCVTPAVWKNIFLRRFPRCYFPCRQNSRKIKHGDFCSEECVFCFRKNEVKRGKIICCDSPHDKHNWKQLLKDRLVASKAILVNINRKLCPIIGCLKVLKSKTSYDRHLLQAHDVHLCAASEAVPPQSCALAKSFRGV